MFSNTIKLNLNSTISDFKDSSNLHFSEFLIYYSHSNYSGFATNCDK